MNVLKDMKLKTEAAVDKVKADVKNTIADADLKLKEKQREDGK